MRTVAFGLRGTGARCMGSALRRLASLSRPTAAATLLAASLAMAQPARADVNWVLNANFVGLQNVVNLGGMAKVRATVSNAGSTTAPDNVLNVDVPKGALTFSSGVSDTTPAISGCTIAGTSPDDPNKDRITCTVPSLVSGTQAGVELSFIANQPGEQPIQLAVPAKAGSPASNIVALPLTVVSVTDFTIAGSGNPTVVDPGSDVTYSFTVTNGGPNAGTSPVVFVSFPAGIDAKSVPGNCSLVATPPTDGPSSYRCTYPGTFAVGRQEVLTFTGTVWGAGPTLTVNGRVDYANDSDPDGNSVDIVTTVRPGTALLMAKSHTPARSIANQEQVTFTLRPSFAGQAPAGDFTVTDVFPANFSFEMSGVTASSGWTCSKTGQTLQCTRPTAAGLQRSSLGTIRVVATANWIADDPNNNAPINTATLSSPGLADASASDQTQILRSEVDIQALKVARGGAISGGGVVAGTSFDFDISARNNGTSLGTDSPFFGTLVLDDTLKTNITATNIVTNGWTCNLGSASGPALVTGPVTLPTGSVIHCERTYTIGQPLRRGDVVPPVTVTAVVPNEGSFENVLEAWPLDRNQYTDPNEANNTATFFGTGTTSADSADLSIFKSLLTPQPSIWGQQSDFVIEAQNVGTPDQDSQGVVITDLFNNLASNSVLTVSLVPSDKAVNFTCEPQAVISATSRQLTCRIATLKPCTRGLDCPRINVGAVVAGNSANPQVVTNASNTAFIGATTSDPDPRFNSSTVPFTIRSNPDAFVVKTATPETVNAGSELRYTISSRIASPNSGPTLASFEDTLPLGMTFLRTSFPSGCSTQQVPAPAPNQDRLTTKVSCTVGLISSGARGIDIFVSPGEELAGQGPIRNTVTLTAEPDSTPDNNTAFADVTVQSTTPRLTVQKVDDPHISYVTQEIAYRVKVSNLGGATATNVDVRDTLPANMTFVSFTSPAGTTCQGVPAAGASTTGVVIQCTVASLATGDAQSKFFDMRLKSTEVSNPVNSVAVRLNANSPTPDAEASTTSIVLSRVDLEVVSKTAVPASVGFGEEFTYTIPLRNRTGVDPVTGITLDEATNVALTDALPQGMVLAGPPVASVQSGTTTQLSCTGAAGDTAFTCNFGTVSNGAAFTVTVPARVITLGAGGLPQTFTNEARVSTDSSDIDAGNDWKRGSVTVSAANSLSGVVFRDFNNNGVQDPGDTGVGGISMSITPTGAPGTSYAPVSTAADGSYSFERLPVGTYTVTRGPVAPSLELSDGTVTPGNPVNGTVSSPVTISGITFTAPVSAVGYDFALVPRASGLEISKARVGEPVVNADGTVSVGFVLTVTNPSSEEIGDVTVTDPLAGAAPQFGRFDAALTSAGTYRIASVPSGSCGGLNPGFDGSGTDAVASGFTLAVGAVCDVGFTLQVRPTNPLPPVVSGGNYLNAASVAGTGSLSGQAVSAQSDIVPVLVPELSAGIALVKEGVLTGNGTDPENDGTEAGDTITYSFRVTNTGVVTLTGVTVTDPKLTNIACAATTLQPGEQTSCTSDPYVITEDEFAAGQVDNTAMATGTPPSGEGVSSTASVTLSLPTVPRLVVVKEMTGYTDADGSGSVTLGDVLSYRITATNTGNVTLTGVTISDDRITPGSTVCPTVSARSDCSLTGTYTIVIADVQAGAVVNTATADSNETDPMTASTTTPVVALVNQNTLAKAALVSTAKRGEKVPYVITAQLVPFNPARIVDVMPPGFSYVTGSAAANGKKVDPALDGRRLTFDALVPDATGAIKLELTLVASASVKPGVAVNQAQLVDPGTGAVVATAKARVTILAEAVFDCGDIIGKVFDDQNRNGYQDEGEPGLPAVRVATVGGLLVTSDANGRFNIPCADIPDAAIGSNFILKLDTRTLPTGYHLTTENPRRVRLTRGKVVKLNFGASISRLVKLELNSKVFEQGSSVLLPKWQSGLDSLMKALEAENSVLEITYRGKGDALAKERLRAVRDAISRRWSAVHGGYDLAINTRIVGVTP